MPLASVRIDIYLKNILNETITHDVDNVNIENNGRWYKSVTNAQKSASPNQTVLINSDIDETIIISSGEDDDSNVNP